MINSIAFKDPSKWIADANNSLADNDPAFGYDHHIRTTDDLTYELKLPSISGRRFDLKTGLNVVVGPNGSGKTSLLNVIRNITFCTKKNSSEYNFYIANDSVDGGLYQCCDMVADYGKSVFNMILTHDLSDDEVMSSPLTLLQRFDDNSQSSGQATFSAINQMVGTFLNNGKDEWSKGRWEKDFDKSVLADIRKRKDFEPKDRPSVNQMVLDYYKCNNKKSGVYTFLLDEPDRGLDVDHLNKVYDFLIGNYKVDWAQVIVVIHNVALISKLLKSEYDINWIEMSDGYLKKVKDFVG